MYSKMTAAAESAKDLIQSRPRWPSEIEDLKKGRRIAEPLSKEQFKELLTMTGTSQTA
ncbi:MULTISPECIES: hypothetical protein [Shimia]|uniref:hypothetical protein n=1 Tax=Shimia TaxID=573139 RepID=UPI001FB3997C|nr:MULTISPECIES: hypothetical protein [Shimia]MDV4146543.1 hypothetical protein [Shimia sp. FJ5]